MTFVRFPPLLVCWHCAYSLQATPLVSSRSGRLHFAFKQRLLVRSSRTVGQVSSRVEGAPGVLPFLELPSRRSSCSLFLFYEPERMPKIFFFLCGGGLSASRICSSDKSSLLDFPFLILRIEPLFFYGFISPPHPFSSTRTSSCPSFLCTSPHFFFHSGRRRTPFTWTF